MTRDHTRGFPHRLFRMVLALGAGAGLEQPGRSGRHDLPPADRGTKATRIRNPSPIHGELLFAFEPQLP